MIWRTFYCVFILVLLRQFVPLFAQGEQIEVAYKNYRIVYSAQDEVRARAVMKILEMNIPRLEHFYAAQIKGPVYVFLPQTRQEFNRLTGGAPPEWSAAVYMPSRRAIVVKKAEWVSSDISLAHEVTHELSHVYFDFVFGRQHQPLWLNEGLAEYLAKAKIGVGEGVIIANALFSKNIVPLPAIDSLIFFSERKARLAYLESLTAVIFLNSLLLEKNTNWHHFLNAIKGSGFSAGLKETVGVDPIDFNIKWYRSVRQKYRWFVVFNLENLIWLLMVFVLVGAMYALRYRNRKRLREWEELERYEIKYFYEGGQIDDDEGA